MTSANVVGYSYTEVCAGYSAFTPTFKQIGEEKPVYLSQIIPQPTTTTQYNTSGKSGTCKGSIMVQLLSDAEGGAYGTIYYFYRTDPNDGENYFKWYKLVESELVEIGAKEVSIPNGIGFCVINETGA